jgi:hypothetical protein
MNSSVSSMRSCTLCHPSTTIRCPRSPSRHRESTGHRRARLPEVHSWLLPSYTCAPCVPRRISVKPGGLVRRFAARHGQRTPPPNNESSPSFVWDYMHRHLLVCPGLAELRNHFRISPEHEIIAGPDVQLANFLIAMTQYPLHPASCVTGGTAVEPDESAPPVDCVGPPFFFSSSSIVFSCKSVSQEVPGRRHHRDEADEVMPPRLHMWSRIAGDGLQWWFRI